MRSLTIVCATWKPEIRGTISQKAPFLATWQDESSIKIDWTTRFWQYCGTLKKILFSKSEKSDNSMRHLETRNPGHYFTESPFSCYLTRWILDKNWLNHARFWQYCGTLKKILFSKSEKSDNSMRHLETRNPGHYFTESPFSCYLTRWILDKNWLNHAILAILWYIEENTIFQKWEVWQ